MNGYELSQLQLLGKVGKGSFGEVFKVKKETGEIFAAKISISSVFDDDENDDDKNPKAIIRNLVREINIMSKFNHPSLIKFIGFSPINFEGEKKPVIITEFLSNGTLNDLIILERKGLSHEKWNDTRKLIVLYGIASAMSFLHSNKILHRDLKPENIMMDDELYPKITDFGLSKITHSNEESMSMNSTKGIKGTLIYMPPESLFECEYSKAGDVYAFAMIAYEIMTNEKPFGKCNFSELTSKIIKGERPVINDIIPDSYRNLIIKSWDQESSNRPTFEEIANELKENPGFITDSIDEDEFYNYIDYIDEYKTSFNSDKKVVSVDEFMKSRKAQPKEKNSESKTHKKGFSLNDIINNINDQSKLFKMFADNEDPEMMCVYAYMLYEGKDTEVNKKEAAVYFKKAADLGDLKSMIFYSEMLHSGDGIPIDKVESAKYLKMAADKGDEHAIYEYGRRLLNGDEIPGNKIEAAKYLKLIADKENLNATLLYIHVLQNLDESQVDKKEIAKYLKIAADQNHVLSMLAYGVSFFEEDNDAVDKKEGIKYLKMAADNGNVNAMKALAKFLIDGYGVPADEKEGIKYLKMAADNGDVNCMNLYARFLYNGKGMPIDKEESIKYFKMAADKGDADALKVYNLICLEAKYDSK